MWDYTDYLWVVEEFPRLLGVVFLVAQGAFLWQIRALIGEEGILPSKSYLHHMKRFRWELPSLFWFCAEDWCLVAVNALGCFLALLLILGFCPIPCLFGLVLIHLSLVVVGQDFMRFGWESLLIEIGFFTLLFVLAPNGLTWWNLNLLHFRFYIMAGTSKWIHHDETWRQCTALQYHYETQPIPNMWAWFAHRLPCSMHKISVVMMLLIEIVVPFGIFFGEWVRLGVFGAFFGLQLFIWLTGNFSYLNLMTAVFATTLISDRFGGYSGSISEMNGWVQFPIILLALYFLVMQCFALWTYYSRNETMENLLYHVQKFHLVSYYQLFASMTKKRYEIVLEGSDDQVEWKEYHFKYKPSEESYRPRRISPYQPRLDWQVWFLPFYSFYRQGWFHAFLRRVLEGNQRVLSLLRFNPFPDNPPKYMRVKLYLYRFTTWGEKGWWKREYIEDYSPILSLDSYC